MAESIGVARTAQAPQAFKGGELAFLYLPLFTVALGYGAVLPILPTLLQRLHGGANDPALALHAGLLTGIYIGSFVIGAPLWGRLVDRYAPRPVLLIGLLGYAAATVWFGFADSLASAYASRFVAGSFAAGLLPATAAFVVARCRQADRARHLGWVSAATVLGFLVGPALAGFVHDIAGEPSASGASTLHLTAVPIWMTGVIALASVFGVAWGMGAHPSRHSRSATAATAAPRGAARAPLSILLLSCLAAFGLGAFEVGLSLQSQRTWAWSASDLAWLFAVCSLVMLAIQFALFAPLRRLIKPERLVIGGFVVMAVGFALLATSSAYAVVFALVALIALGSGVLLPTLSVATADQAGAAVGTAIGYQNAAGNLGQAAGSAAAGLLFNGAPVAPFAVVAALMLIAAIIGWRLVRLRGQWLVPKVESSTGAASSGDMKHGGT
ncbi:MAG TPA: MFS transporter [Steroidobacteraceae bacterium]|nr:MFS transporter [Steroidobacteraceae bacterium]